MDASRRRKDVRFVLLSPIRHEDLRAHAARPARSRAAQRPARGILQGHRGTGEGARQRGLSDRFKLWNWRRDLKRSRSLPTIGDEIDANGIHLSEWLRHADETAPCEFGWDLGSIGLTARSSTRWTERRAQRSHVALRAAVVRKNELFFHRFRPENSTYLFGFRKHEQGQNAKEIPDVRPPHRRRRGRDRPAEARTADGGIAKPKSGG